MDNQILRTELALPAYADMIAAGDDQGICELLNAPGTGTVSRGIISKDQFVTALSAGLSAIFAKPDSDPVKAAFAGWLELLKIVTNIDTSNPAVTGTLAAAVQAGVFTQAESDAALLRPCSRAEQLGGAGVAVSASDVAGALHEGRQAGYEQAQAAIRAKAAELLSTNPEMELREALERADQLLNGASWGHS